MLPARVLPELSVGRLSRQPERRFTRRYPLGLKVYYKLLSLKNPAVGFGETIDVSSRGVLFEAESWLVDYGKIELALKWPFLLEGSCDLQLLMRGRIVRVDDRKVAVRSDFYEFRTAGRTAFEKIALHCPSSARRLNAASSWKVT